MLPDAMRAELVSRTELTTHLRKEGIADISEVHEACMEADGMISIIGRNANKGKQPLSLPALRNSEPLASLLMRLPGDLNLEARRWPEDPPVHLTRAFLLAINRSRNACSRMKPSASFWS